MFYHLEQQICNRRSPLPFAACKYRYVRCVYVEIGNMIFIYDRTGINSVVLYWFATGAGMRVPRIVFKSVLNAIYPISFLQNTLTTGLIAYRLIRQHRQSSGSGVHQAGSQLDLYTIIRILIESAMLYTLELLLVIVLYALKHHAQYVVMYAMSPTIGKEVFLPAGIQAQTFGLCRHCVHLDRMSNTSQLLQNAVA